MSFEYVHGTVHAPEAEGMTAGIDARLVQKIHAYAAGEGGWIIGCDAGTGRSARGPAGGIALIALQGHDTLYYYCTLKLASL
mmetsp:Transcript_27552/g.60374  ORF Transcript_27552/g.60374 Transcript_27552/m.60374 type:complete len:82 (+) Transcript_27552:257-502(+)